MHLSLIFTILFFKFSQNEDFFLFERITDRKDRQTDQQANRQLERQTTIKPTGSQGGRQPAKTASQPIAGRLNDPITGIAGG